MAFKKETLQDLNLSNDEVTRLTKAFENEEFRKLFVEYAEEISNPENKKKYEEEIRELENERGMNVEFIHPEPGHVLKTSIDDDVKAFINICQSDKIGKPSSKREVSSDGMSGMNWSIPHSHVQPRDDVDKKKGKCKVFEVVFHPDTYRMAENPRFLKLVEDTAIDGIENQLGFKVDRKNIVRMKNMKFKGTPSSCVIRTRRGPAEPTKKRDADDIINQMPDIYGGKTSEERTKEMIDAVQRKKEKEQQSKEKTKLNKEKKESEFTEPKYTILHRTDLDIQEFRNAPDSRPSTRPKELEIKVFLPLLTSAAQVDLDVFEQKLVMSSKEPAKYKLELKLPYPVDDEEGGAKFDKSKKCLVVTLPVIPAVTPEHPLLNGNLASDECRTEKDDVVQQQQMKPLIEELPDLQNSVTDDLDVNVAKTEPVEESLLCDSDMRNEAKVMTNGNTTYSSILYTLPDFTFNQDEGTVSFILKVRNVKLENISKTFPSKNSVLLTLVSVGSGGFPIHYRFSVVFPEGHLLAPEHCSIDISDSNVVVVLLKNKACRGFWNHFHAGISADKHQQFLFVTEANIQQELDELEADAARLKLEQHTSVQVDSPMIQVSDMSEKQIQIQIKKTGSVDVDDDVEIEKEDAIDSGNIEVIHDKGLPLHLHGILKQRSMSESSDDHSSCSPSSPRDDPFGQRKSVKFNDYIDHTTFKTNASVSRMTCALKSKRRRNRKREEKKAAGRRRQNSGGSEGSSSEEMENRSHKSSLSEESEDGVEEKLEDVCEEDNDDGKNPPARESQFVKNIKDKITNTKHLNMQEDSDDDDDDDNLRTKGHKSEEVKNVKTQSSDDNHERTSTAVTGEKVEDAKLSENVKTEVSQNDSVNESENDEVKDGEIEKIKVSESEKVEMSEDVKMGGKKHAGGDESVSKDLDVISCTDIKETKQSKHINSESKGKEDRKGCLDGVVLSAGDVASSGLPQNLNEGDNSVIKISAENLSSMDDSGVESGCEKSSLADGDDSWKDTSSVDLSAQDHRTKCAFDFSNAVIYDLDID